MPTKVNIKIKGLAACFLRDDDWNIVFIGDDVHPVDFTYPDGKGGRITTSLRKKGSDLTAAFETDTFISLRDRKGPDFNSIFNMAGGYAHGPDTLNVERRKKATDLVWLKVPEAVLDTHSLTAREYFVQELKYPGAPVQIIPRIANVLSLTASVEGLRRLKVDDPMNTSYDPPLPLPSSAAIDLEFNNDCGANCTHNDFVDLYEFVKEKIGDRQFVAGQLKVRKYLDWKKVDEGQTTPSPDYGNCDPVVIEPPPG